MRRESCWFGSLRLHELRHARGDSGHVLTPRVTKLTLVKCSEGIYGGGMNQTLHRIAVAWLLTAAVSLAWPLSALAQATVARPAPEERVLNFSNWPDYIPEGMLAEFESRTGIKVRYRTFESNEELQKQVELGTDVDDLVVPGLGYAKEQLAKGLYRSLDKSLLPNLANIDPDLLKAMEAADPGNRHLVPWAWGYNTLFLNRTQVAKALSESGGDSGKPLPFPGNEWDLVFNPAYTRKLRGCGIAMLESPSEVVPLALMYLGKRPYSQNVQDYREATTALKGVRTDVRVFSNKMVQTLSKGDLCAAIAWSGDIRTAIEILKSRGSRDVLEGVQPKRGATRFVDVLAIPKGAKHPRNAHAFINFYLEAVQAARMPNEIGYPNGNLAALPHVQPSVRRSALVFPPEAFVSALVSPDGYTPAARWAMMQTFLSFAFHLKLD